MMGRTTGIWQTQSLQVPSRNPLAFCRLCFSKNVYKKITLQQDALHWIDYIQRTVGIQMTVEVDLPFGICIGCKTTLESVDQFRRICRSHDTALRQFREGKVNYEIGESTTNVTPELPIEIIATDESEVESQEESKSNSPTFDNNHCHACEKDFQSDMAFKRHMKKIHGKTGGIVACPLCPCRFRKNALFQQHMLRHPDRQKIFSSVVVPLGRPVKRKMCRFCNQFFKVGKEMGQHEENQHGLKFECKLCYKRFPSEKDRHIHKLMHLAGMGGGSRKSFKCKICSRVFPNRHCYNIHVKKHEKCYMCWSCMTKFSSLEQYVQHQIAVHQSEGTMGECVECRETFTAKQGFIDHLNLKHAAYDQDLANDELSETEDGGSMDTGQNPEGESSRQRLEPEQPEPETVSLSSSDDFPVYMDDENGDDDEDARAVAAISTDEQQQQQQQQSTKESITDRLEEELIMLDEVPRDSGFDLYGTAFQPQNTISLIDELSD